MKNKYYVILLVLFSIISIIFITPKIDTNNTSYTNWCYKITSVEATYNPLEVTREELTTNKCMPIGEYKIIFSDNELVFDGDDSCVAYLKEGKSKERQVMINDDFRSYVNNLVKEKGE